MKIKDIKNTIDPYITIWINENEESELYISSEDIPADYDDKEVIYITLDGNKELTLEV